MNFYPVEYFGKYRTVAVTYFFNPLVQHLLKLDSFQIIDIFFLPIFQRGIHPFGVRLRFHFELLPERRRPQYAAVLSSTG